MRTDPMAERPAIQASYAAAPSRAEHEKTLAIRARTFRRPDDITPIVLMGYYNRSDILRCAKFSPTQRRWQLTV